MRYLVCIFWFLACYATASASDCFEEGEREAMLALDARTFDQSRDNGWRLVAERECYSEAAALIDEYRAQATEQEVKDGLRHHQMQMYAAAELRPQAVGLLDEIIVVLQAEGPLSELAYKQATRAFLLNDRAELEAARNDLASLPMPESFAAAIADFSEKYPDFPAPKWPVNLDVVDGFINCFGKPYSEAYAADCRPLETYTVLEE